MKLTAIRAQQRERGRVNLELDGSFAFSVQTILAARLTVGQDLSESDIDALRSADVLERAYERALNYLSYRPRSEDEMRQYLAKRGLEPEAADKVTARLKRAGLVDDRAFAEFWVENRETFRPRGTWALRSELRQKGVPTPVIDGALSEVDDRASAMRAAETAARRYGRQEREVFMRRMFGYLQRRGFSYSISREVAEHCWEQIQQDKMPGSDDPQGILQ